jgi:hypothetical protein
MKCTVVKVAVFGYKGKNYRPGEVVEVPKRFATLDFLTPVPEKPSFPEKKQTKKESAKKEEK